MRSDHKAEVAMTHNMPLKFSECLFLEVSTEYKF